MDNSQAHKKLTALFDDGVFAEIDAFAKSANGEIEVAAGYGSVGGSPAYAFAQDISVNGGAISVAQCAKIKKIYDLALKTGCPVISIFDSNGVKITEGFEVLSAYGDLVKSSAQLSGVVPQIAVVAGACLGTSALIANMADVVVAVKDADFYVTAPSEITTDDSAKSGIIDILSDDFEEAVSKVRLLNSILPLNNLSIGNWLDFSEPSNSLSKNMSAGELVLALADEGSVVELKKEYADNVVTALATVNGRPVGFVAFDEKSICPSCAYKAESIIKLCDAFNLPIITIADANGLADNCESRMLIAATKLTCAYACATCPKISLVTKQSIGSAYIILAGKGANADLTFAWDTAVASPLDADSAVAFLFNERLAKGENRETLEKEYKETIGSAYTAAACGAVDDVFTYDQTRAKLITALEMTEGKRETTMPRKHSVK